MTRPVVRPVVVHVDALDLSALPAARRAVVASAFVRELEELLALAPPLAQPAAAREPCPALRIAGGPAASPERLGAALARAVHGELTRAPSGPATADARGRSGCTPRGRAP